MDSATRTMLRSTVTHLMEKGMERLILVYGSGESILKSIDPAGEFSALERRERCGRVANSVSGYAAYGFLRSDGRNVDMRTL